MSVCSYHLLLEEAKLILGLVVDHFEEPRCCPQRVILCYDFGNSVKARNEWIFEKNDRRSLEIVNRDVIHQRDVHHNIREE